MALDHESDSIFQTIITVKRSLRLLLIIVLSMFTLACAARNASSSETKVAAQPDPSPEAVEASLSAEQKERLSAYGITLTPEQIACVDVDAFLHDMDCFFGEARDSAPYALRVENAEGERFEGAGYAYQRWIGGEMTMEEMLIGDVQVYEKERSFPIWEDVAFPE